MTCIDRKSVRLAVLGTAAAVTGALLAANVAAQEPELVAVAAAQGGVLAAASAVELGRPAATGSLRESNPGWLVVVIQATLAQRACNSVAVNGAWDEATAQAVRGFLARDGVELASVEPSAGLLEQIRTAKAPECAASAQPEAGQAGARAAKSKPRPAGAGEREARRPRSDKVATSSAASPSRQPQAPAVFVRPVGAGAF